MDFDCEQKDSVHFFYTLPYSKNTALIETTWLSRMNDVSQKDYDSQIKDYIENHLKLKKIHYSYPEGSKQTYSKKVKKVKKTKAVLTCLEYCLTFPQFLRLFGLLSFHHYLVLTL